MSIIDDCIAGFTTYFTAHPLTFQLDLLNLRLEDVKQYVNCIGFDTEGDKLTLETMDSMYEHKEVVACMIKGETPANVSDIISAFQTAFPSTLDSYLSNSGWWEYTEINLR